MTVSTTVHLYRCLERLHEADAQARSELLAYARRRLKLLADRMFERFPQLRYHEHADDLLQESMFRLWQSLEQVGPTSVAQFMGLAALQMRRSLCDFSRNHFGRNKDIKRSPVSVFGCERGNDLATGIAADVDENAPDELMCWSDFHEAADRLPEPDRTAFDLLFYHELPQAEVAEMMNISVRQVRRHWQSARLKLCRMMGDAWPQL